MILKVFPGQLTQDVIWAPPSKSITQRLIAMATVAKGTTVIRRPSESDDCTHAMMMAAQLGADVELGEDAIAIHGRWPLVPRADQLTPGESGLGMRLFACLASLQPKAVSFERSGSLLKRDLTDLQDILRAFQVEVDGTAPGQATSVRGQIQHGEVHIDASGSSQVLTGLLCALPHGTATSKIRVQHVVSRPYVDMTLEILEDMGIAVSVVQDDSESRELELLIDGNQRAHGIDVAVDGDWSAAAFLLALGALCAPQHLSIEGLCSTYTQADEAVKGAMLFGGCRLAGTDDGVQVKSGRPKGFDLDLTDAPDLFPPLAALAAFGKNPSTFRGVHRLANKESNRASVIQQEWRKAGIQVDIDHAADTMVIHPGDVQSARLDAHGDHRIAMAAALFGAAGAPIEIVGAECVAKSYPAFFDDLEALGIRIQVIAG